MGWEGGPIYKNPPSLPHSIQAWGNNYWSNEAIELWPSLIKDRTRRTLNSTTEVAYRAHGSVNSVSIFILKHWHGLVTNRHRLPIVLQSAAIVSAADVSVKL